jgi:pimeloyl-ACP methyl ester carboxylesterase
VRQKITRAGQATISYSKYGNGPPLVLVHGAFSDDDTNWEFVKPTLQDRFTIYAIARRGRGDTDTTDNHVLKDEAQDVLAVMETVGEPLFLLGHSYGGHCSLVASAIAPQRVRKLVLYEPVWPHRISKEGLEPLEKLAAAGAWDDFAMTFFRDLLSVPVLELDALRVTDLWPPIVADAKASLRDLRAISRYNFDAERFRGLDVPVLLQIGSESPRDLYVTDALARVLPDARIEVLPGQAHEG